MRLSDETATCWRVAALGIGDASRLRVSLTRTPNHMSSTSPRADRITTVGAIAILAIVAACARDKAEPTGLRTVSANARELAHFVGQINICKYAGPAGNYTFQLDVVGGGNYLAKYGLQPTVAFDGTTSNCMDAYMPRDPETWTEGAAADVTFTELVPEGMRVDSIIVRDSWTGIETKLTGTTSATV